MQDGKKILFEVIKARRRGEEDRIPEEDIAFARENGFLFDYPKYESHEEMYERLQSILPKIDPKDIANAFLYSLSTRSLEYRSALGSYYYAKAIPEHEFMNSYNEVLAKAADHCYLCGWTAWKAPDLLDLRWSIGYDSFNYIRYKYGGYTFYNTEIRYALFDLEQFLKLPKVVPCEEDIRIFKAILSCVEKLEPKDKVGKLRSLITKEKIIKSNKDEVSVLLGELGICGILAGKDYPSYDVFFANEYQRDPAEHKNDFEYPVNRWYARDGINTEKLREVFGDSFF